MSVDPLEALNVALWTVRLPLLDREELDRRLEIARERADDATVALMTAREAGEIVAAIAATGELVLALEAAAAASEACADLLISMSCRYAKQAADARADLAHCMHEAGAPPISTRGLVIEPLEPSASVEITGAVPEPFLRPAAAREPNKAAIGRELRRGAALNWARLSYGPPRVRLSAKDSA